ncbi:MAG: hypothetical protein U0457_07720 [Candidatus Sericytochromatia bacterium]
MNKKIKLLTIVTILTNFFVIYSCQEYNQNDSKITTPSSLETPKTVASSIVNQTSDITDVNKLITQKCTYCHSITPNSDSGYTKAPKDITFDSDKEINNSIKKIKKVVANKSMPIGDIVLTTNEITLISNWEIKATNKKSTAVSDIADLKQLITQKCTYCHSNTPNSASGYTKAPKNITFDSDKEINDNSDLIKKVVADRSMPIGNISISDNERDLVKNWLIKNTSIDIKPSELPSTELDKNNPINKIIIQRCAYCHSITPNSASGYTKAPRNIIFDSDKEINDNSDLIKKVVADKSMPIGNISMPDNERDIIKNWVLNNSNSVTQNTPKIKLATDIITQKCTYCHSANPDPSSGYTKAPKNRTYDSIQEMEADHDDIGDVVYRQKMPIKGITMTTQERNIIVAWADEKEKEEEQKPFWSRLIGKLKL